MEKSTIRARIPRSAASAAVLAGAALFLSGCGGRSPEFIAFCSKVPSLTAVRIHRTTIPASSYTFSFPADVTVTDGVSARQLAQDVCHLRNVPNGTFNCPDDVGIDYQIRFLAERRQVAQIEADPSGCSFVTGLGGHALSPTFRFWNELDAILQVPGQRVNCNPLLGSAPLNYPTNCGAILTDP